MHVVYDTTTRAVLAIHADPEAALPEGAAALDLPDDQAAIFNTADVAFALNEALDGVETQDVPPPPPDARTQAIETFLDPASGFPLLQRQAFAVILGVDPPGA